MKCPAEGSSALQNIYCNSCSCLCHSVKTHLTVFHLHCLSDLPSTSVCGFHQLKDVEHPDMYLKGPVMNTDREKQTLPAGYTHIHLLPLTEKKTPFICKFVDHPVKTREQTQDEIYSTSPGRRRPAEGEMLMSESSGGVKQNNLGPSTVTVSSASAVAVGLNWLLSAWRLVRWSVAVDLSPTAVALNWTRQWESSSGGRRPTARQDSRNSLMTN